MGRKVTLEDDDLPPAYSTNADTGHGEHVVEAGPSHPFQSSPAIQHFPVPPPGLDVGEGRPGVGLSSPYAPLAPLPGTQGWPHTQSQPPPPLPARRKQYEPTDRYTPGQPLLHDGKLLVFPQGGSSHSHTECPKCRDTGYRAYSPSSPCSSCWKKFGKPYTSSLRHSLTLSGAEDGDPIGLQKRLPDMKPQPHHSPTNVPPPQMSPPPMWNYSNPGSMPPPAPPTVLPSGPFGYHPMPPPGSIIVRAGDPRLGGRLCTSCGGDGLVSGGFFGLEQITCRYCNGSGRVYW